MTQNAALHTVQYATLCKDTAQINYSSD